MQSIFVPVCVYKQKKERCAGSVGKRGLQEVSLCPLVTSALVTPHFLQLNHACRSTRCQDSSFPQVWPLTHTKGPFRVGWSCAETCGGIPQHPNLFLETDLTTRVLSISLPWINSLGESERPYAVAGSLRFHLWKFPRPFCQPVIHRNWISWPISFSFTAKKAGSTRVLTKKLLMVVAHWKPWRRRSY